MCQALVVILLKLGVSVTFHVPRIFTRGPPGCTAISLYGRSESSKNRSDLGRDGDLCLNKHA